MLPYAEGGATYQVECPMQRVCIAAGVTAGQAVYEKGLAVYTLREASGVDDFLVQYPMTRTCDCYLMQKVATFPV